MATSKKINIICVALTLLAIAITILFMNGESIGITRVIDEDAEANSDSVFFTANDLNGSWSTTYATKITLSDSGSKVVGSGAYAEGSDVIISRTGYYMVTGSVQDGQIVIKADGAAKVWLCLNNVTMNCNDDACIRVDNADKVFITLKEDTSNFLTSGEVYSEEAIACGSDAVIFSRDDLTINGDGSLDVNGLYKHGIASTDSLVITCKEISVSALSSAIRANESLRICNTNIVATSTNKGIVVKDPTGYLYVESGKLFINSNDDAIHTTGVAYLAGGEIDIVAGDDAIQSDTEVFVGGGTIRINTCYEGINAPTVNIAGGTTSIYPEDDGISAKVATETETPEVTVAPVNTGFIPSVNITGGTLMIDNPTANGSDGIDSDGNVTVSGGTLIIHLLGNGNNSTVDYANENGGTFIITGGTVQLSGSFEKTLSPSPKSTQCSIFINPGMIVRNSLVELKDKDGNALISFEAPSSFNNMTLSHPSLKQGETYTLTLGDETESITLSNIVTCIDASVVTESGQTVPENADVVREPGEPPFIPGVNTEVVPETYDTAKEEAVPADEPGSISSLAWIMLGISGGLIILGMGATVLFKSKKI